MSRQKTLAFLMFTMGATGSAFLLPAKQPAYCTRRFAGAAVSQDELKKLVGYKSVDDYVQSGMVVGLGTGSTAAFAGECVCVCVCDLLELSSAL